MTLPLTAATDTYEARYGWTPSQLRNLVPLLVVLLVSVVMTKVQPSLLMTGLFVVSGLLCLFGLALNCLIWFSGKAAIRVDEDGITFGGSPLRYEATTVLVPWSEIVAVELWMQQVGVARTIRYVGLHRVPGSAPLPGLNGKATTTVAKSLTGKSPELINASRATVAWKYQPRELLGAVERFAPQVKIYVDPGFRL